MYDYKPFISVVDELRESNVICTNSIGDKNLLPDRIPSVNPPAEYDESPAVNVKIISYKAIHSTF